MTEPVDGSLGLSVGELEVFLLLQRANLSQYFKAFIDHGGDDVRQLVEMLKDPQAFDDLLRLVGMNKKPLHIRRFQRALQEFSGISRNGSPNTIFSQIQNPSLLENLPKQPAFSSITTPLSPLQTSIFPYSLHFPSLVPGALRGTCSPQNAVTTGSVWPALSSSSKTFLPGSTFQLLMTSNAQATTIPQPTTPSEDNVQLKDVRSMHSTTSTAIWMGVSTQAPAYWKQDKEEASKQEPFRTSPQGSHDDKSPMTSATPALSLSVNDPAGMSKPRHSRMKAKRKVEEHGGYPDPLGKSRSGLYRRSESVCQILEVRPSAALMLTDMSKLNAAFNAMIYYLPVFRIRKLNARNSRDRELQKLLSLPQNDATRLEGIRSHSVIFGRFDAVKRLNRPLRHFEMCVNEITQRLVQQFPELVTQREHLFHIARQIVNITNYGMTIKESGEIIWGMLEPDLLGKSVAENGSLNHSPEGEMTNPNSEPTKETYLKILGHLKIEMQELVDKESELREKIQNFKRDKGTLTQSQPRRLLERVICKLHDRLQSTAKYVVLHKSTADE
ncbi:unnamed protein product [Dicrocoelium dendriticum]|nr:unnamed protein product [Dicrocoelium dendriticum]